LYNLPVAGRLPAFVARQEQVDFLRAHGDTQVRAIGLPILYTPAPTVRRLPRSLLVMPTHTLVGAKFPDRAPFERYAAEIKTIADRFERVVVCVHPCCRHNGLWIQEFSALGFEIIDGAQTDDRNALRRMRSLFTQFEAVTSNDWGGHIAYALTFGARVSIYGTPIVYTKENALLDVTWAADIKSLEVAGSDQVREQKRRYLSRLFREPADGVLDVEWGRWLTGAAYLLSPEEMRSVWARIVKPLPSKPALSAAPRERRRLVQMEARDLVRTGAPERAAVLLLRFLRVAIETRDLRFLHETLVEFAADLDAFDARGAAHLRQQACSLESRLNPSRNS
jgi:hypothetical protein